MLFGQSFAKIQVLRYQKMSNDISMRLPKISTLIKNREKFLKQRRTGEYNIWLQGKQAWIAQHKEQIEIPVQQGEPTPGDQQLEMMKYQQALQDWQAQDAIIQQQLDAEYDAESDYDLQAYHNEEEQLTIDKTFADNMQKFWEPIVQQLEKWFQTSLDLITGGGRR